MMVIGSAAGFAAGYTFKRAGQILLAFVGLEIMALHLMENQGWIVVNWPLINRDISQAIESGAFDRVVDAIKLNLPLTGSFTAGCYAGFNWN